MQFSGSFFQDKKDQKICVMIQEKKDSFPPPGEMFLKRISPRDIRNKIGTNFD